MVTAVKCTSTTSTEVPQKKLFCRLESEVQSTILCTTTAFTKVLQTK